MFKALNVVNNNKLNIFYFSLYFYINKVHGYLNQCDKQVRSKVI